jgi:predicted dehydrogenase/threonine dehydrogenase-like Zn-dependent dehydrogenase
MKQLLQNYRTGEMRVEDVPAPSVQPGGVVVRNRFSVVSAGTERATVEFARQSMLGKARSRPDLVRQVISKVRRDGLRATYKTVMSSIDQFMPMGYSCAGEVVEVGEGVDSVSVGDLVACAGGGYASHSEVVYVPRNLVVPLPDGVTPEQGAFGTLGAIAMQGIRRAELMPGESVAVIGLGLIGQITVQILQAYGCPVMGIDIDPAKVAAAQQYGMEASGVIGVDDLAATAQTLSGGVGVDAVVITAATRDSGPVELAGELARERGRISAVGDVGLDIPRRIYYAKELDVRVSRSYGPGRYDASYEEHGIDYPLPYARWTEGRNMAEFLRLVGSGRINLDPIITHTFPIDQATDAYKLVIDNPNKEAFLGVLLEYPAGSVPLNRRVTLNKPISGSPGVVNVGLVGAGSFARGTITPIIEQLDGLHLRAVASARGASARDVADRYKAEYATSDPAEIMADDQIQLVVASARHNVNNRIAVEALIAGKHVHVEKPLALNLDQLRDVAAAARSTDAGLMVGFNRRFAPHIATMKKAFEGRSTPLMMHYRVNAGFIPADSWVHDPVEGGGRIIGEACHFIDLLHFIAGAPPTRVFATRLPPSGDAVLSDDNVLISLEFADGSRGSVAYSALGAANQPKEHIEVMGGGQSALLDDFRQLQVFDGNKTNKTGGRQDKGHRAQFEAFTNAIVAGGAPPIPQDELLLSSLATILVDESLRTGAPVDVDLSILDEPSPEEESEPAVQDDRL